MGDKKARDRGSRILIGGDIVPMWRPADDFQQGRARRIWGDFIDDFQRADLVVANLPYNVATPIIVAATLLVGATIIAESGLSFLGFGVIVPTPTWGNMLNSAQSEMLNGHWWMAVFPGMMIFLTVICCNRTEVVFISQTHLTHGHAG